MKKRDIKVVISLIVFIGFVLALYFVKIWQMHQEVKKIFLAPYHISFDVPKFLKVEPMQDSNSIVSLDEVKASNFDEDKKGVSVTYSVRRPWTPNIYNIPYGNAFNKTGQITKLDSASLVENNSSILPSQVTMYTYLLGDERGVNRGRLGSGHQGEVRVDFESPDRVITSEAIFFKCTDNTTGSGISKRCGEILKTFVSSLRVEGAKAITSPPSLEDKNYLGKLSFKKKFFDNGKKILPNIFLSMPEKAFFYFSGTHDAELISLSDEKLQSMRCMHQQIYLNEQEGAPYYSRQEDKVSGNIFSIRTTDANNLFYEVKINDQNLYNLVNNVDTVAGKNYMELTQFFACQTREGKMVVKYNGKKFAPFKAGDQSVNYLNEKIINAEIAMSDAQGNLEKIVTIPLPQNHIYCENPLALTTENIFYMACNTFDTSDWWIENTRYIYRIDLNNKNYSLLSECNFSYSEKDLSKSASPITTCK